MSDITEFYTQQVKRASEIAKLAADTRNDIDRLTADLQELSDLSSQLDRMEAIAYEISGSGIAALARKIGSEKTFDKPA